MVQSSTTIDTTSAPISVEYLPSAEEMLTSKVRKVIEGALPIFERLSAEAGIGPSRIVVSGHISPEEGTRTVFLTQYVDIDPEQALDHWDRLAVVYYEWASTLPIELRRAARERVSVAIRWLDRAGSV